MKTKTYIITGATSGIGDALIRHLAQDNIVFAGYRDKSKLEKLTEISTNIYPFYIDYAKPETIKLAADYLKSKCTKVDTLVNIAGCVIAGPLEKIEMSEIRRQFDVNVFGHIEFTQNLMEILENSKIINVSSMASFGVFPFISPYCASKRCLDMFFNSLLIENKKNLQIVSIKPGVISTPLWGKSVKENSKYMNNCSGYEKEMEFMISNAKRNELKGLSVNKVVDVILKVDAMKRPKLSYTVGKDAFAAKILSKLPQSIINKLVKFGLNARLKKSIKKSLPF